MNEIAHTYLEIVASLQTLFQGNEAATIIVSLSIFVLSLGVSIKLMGSRK